MLPGFPIAILGTGYPRTPEIIASQSFGQSSSTSGSRSVSVSYPSGTKEGDLVFALATCAGNASLSTVNPRIIIGPEGWAPVLSTAAARGFQTTGTGIGWQMLMRPVQSGDGTFTFQALNSHRINVSVVVVRGAALPLDAAGMLATSAGTISAITAVADLVTLLLLGGFGNFGSAEPTVTGPGTATEILSYVQGSGHSGGSRNWLGYEYELPVGSTGSRVWTENAESNILGLLALASGSPGIWLYDGDVFSASQSWVVPDDVTSINIMCVGAGGRNWPGINGGQGGGGACAYSNGVGVTPGETLTISVGRSLEYNTHNTDECASYVKRSSTTLVLADYGRPSQPTASPGVGNPGAGGLTTNSTGNALIAGTAGDDSTNNGGQAGAPYGYTASAPDQFGIGITMTGTVMQGNYYGYGAGANQHTSSDRAGSTGVVAITWGMNRTFGDRYI